MKDTPITVDASMAIKHPSTDAKVSWVETTGNALAAGQDSIDRIEKRGSILGTEMLVEQTDTRTATQVRSNTRENMSELQAHAISFGSRLEEALGIMATFGGLGDPEKAAGTVQVFHDFSLTAQETAELDVLLKSRQAKEITQKTYLEELKRRETLSRAVDVEDEIATLEKEQEAETERFAAAMAVAGDNTGGNDDGGSNKPNQQSGAGGKQPGQQGTE